MSSSPFIASIAEVIICSRDVADAPADAPPGHLVLELNDGEAMAQLYLDRDDASELVRRLNRAIGWVE